MKLSSRQCQIALGIFAEMPFKLIADRLRVSSKTIYYHWAVLKKKTGVTTMQGLVREMCIGRL